MSNSFRLRWVVLFVCLFAAADGLAQQNFARHNWYFGDTNRGIRFSRSNNTPALVNNKAFSFGTGGSAVASNPINGDLLFYTDGNRIYDITHVPMFNGVPLLASPVTTNQPVAISPIPGASNQYYVFTNPANFTTGGSVSVTTVDMNLSGNEIGNEPPIGRVTSSNVATGLSGRSEAMITVPHADSTNFWLITHENGQDNFTATLIDDSGDFTITSVVSPNVTGFPMSAANFSYHIATGKLAVSPQSANDNIAILNFDNTSGAITFDRHVLTSGVASTTNQAIYDTEWSPSGRFLYISVHGETGITANVLQFDMDAAAGTSLISVLDDPIDRSYGLMIAPDTAIYHLYQATSGGPFLLGRLTDVDSIGTVVTYTPDVFGGSINFNGRQFPEFLPPAKNNLTLSFTTAGSCSNSPISFFPTVTPAADSLAWTFGDGETSSDWSPVHTYESGGTFTVSLTAYLNGQSEYVEAPVDITDFNLELTLVQDTTACRCEFPPPVGDSCNDGPFNVTVDTEGGTGTLTYTWSNGDTGETLTPDSAGYYYVRVSDSAVPGCVAYAGVTIKEYDATDQRANIWYFGQNAGIDFNEQPAVAITGPLDTPEGCSVISDQNGQVIFSTDGVFVYDRNDAIINDDGGIPVQIGGENGSTQSALIVPVPDDETLYYIFTTQQVHGSNTYELRYSLYDIKLQLPAGPGNLTNGDGGLVTYNQLLFTRSTERTTSDGNWLIAHEYGNNSFRAYQISANGIGNPVISSLGSDHLLTEELNGQGYMKVSGNLLAVAFSTSPTSNFIEVFDFVDSTGVVTNFRRLDLDTDQGQVYGVEISGSKILTTIRATPDSYLREVYMSFQDLPVLIPPDDTGVSKVAGAELGAIQTGPDGTIYVAVNGSTALATIGLNSDTLQLSNLTLNAFQLAGGTQSELGLPNFIQEIFTGTPDPSMTITSFCGGTPTTFEGVGTDAIDEFLWSFGDGSTADSANVEYTYPIPPAGTTQDYNVTLRITNRCGLDTLLTQTITISGPPPNPTFLPSGDQPTVCNGPLTLQALETDDPTYSYLWSTGDTTFTIQVDEPQIISLTITNAAGCTSTRDLLIADNRPIVELGPDQNVCQNTAVAALDAQNPGATYAWEINGTSSGNSQTQAVSTASPGTFKYWVDVSDPVTTCSARDSVVFSINESPAFTAVPNTIVCGTTSGTIQLDITGPAGGTFSYSVVGLNSGISLSGIDQDTGPVDPSPIAGLEVDTYVIEVSDQLSGCETTTSVGVNSTSISITNLIAQTPRCDNVALEFDVDAPDNSTYRIIDATTGAVVGASSYPITGTMPVHVTTIAVPVPGEYTIEVLEPSSNACTASETITVVSDALITGSIDYIVCPTITLVANVDAPIPSDITYEWFGSGVNNVDAPTTTAATPSVDGTYTYGVILRASGFCPTTHTVDITITTLSVDFSQSDPCEDNVTLTATPAPPGNYTYRWYRNGTLIPGGGGQTILVTLADHVAGDEYLVEVVSSISGCAFPSPEKVVDVFGEIVVFLDPVSPCSGDVFSIEATDIPGATYQWFENGSLIAGQTGSTLTNLTQEGTYSVIATSANGCPSDEVFTEIRFVADPAGNLPSKEFICNQPGNRDCSNPEPNSCVLQLEAGDGISWQWFKDGAEIAGATNQTLTVTEPGLYSVEIVNAFECTNTDQTQVIEQCQPLIELPNVFRPGGNQTINKTFSVYPFQTFVSETGFQVFIYNRWGEMVYQSNDLHFEWNGTYKGTGSQLLPGGTYTYVIKYYGSLTTAGQQELRGGVMLLR